jgi:hypothetical protein
VINCSDLETEEVPRHFGWQLVEFPITYLGIPLTIRRPTSAQLQPVVDRLANQLPSWKGKIGPSWDAIAGDLGPLGNPRAPAPRH